MERRRFDLGILYNKEKKEQLFDGYYLTKDRPTETRELLGECSCDSYRVNGLTIINTNVRWGSAKANEFVGVQFDTDGKIKLLLGWEEKDTKYTAKAVCTICQKIIQIMFSLNNHGLVEGDEIKEETDKEVKP